MLMAAPRQQWLAHVHPAMLARDLPVLLSLCHRWRTLRHRPDGTGTQGAPTGERRRRKASTVKIGASLHKTRSSRGEVCVNPRWRSRDRLSKPEDYPELMKQQTGVGTSNIQADIDITHCNQQLTSHNCCQRALFRDGREKYCLRDQLLLFLLQYTQLLLLSLP